MIVQSKKSFIEEISNINIIQLFFNILQLSLQV